MQLERRDPVETQSRKATLCVFASSRLRVFLSVSCLFLLLGANALAADLTAPRIGLEPSARSKIEPFLRALPEGEADAARARLASGEPKPRDFLHRLLLERDERYRMAVEAFARDGANAEELEEVLVH